MPLKYEESNLVELKRSLNDDMIKEVIAFLNSYLGGTIYVGINDDGSFYNPTQEEKDLNESRIINWIRDEAIYPNCSDFVDISYNEDQVLTIKINPGDKKPYYLKSKGLTPSGVYIRYGRNKSQASQEEISRMLRERDNIAFESLISKEQDLTFKALERKFEEIEWDFSQFNFKTSGFIDNETGLFTNLAFWISDQYNIDTKMAVYQGMDRDIFRSKKEYDGSIIIQIDKVLEYFDLCNEVRVIIDGSPMRKEILSYNKRAARECILNCYCHRDYSRKSNIKIEFFDDRCEIISPGGFYDGLTLEDALNGLQSFRNEKLVKLLFKLGYIENYASGLTRVFNEYKKVNLVPKIDTSLTLFKIILPNINFKAFNHQDKIDKHRSDLNGDVNGVVNGDVNGVVNDELDNWIKDIVIKLTDPRDIDIIQTIGDNPGIKMKELVNILKRKYPKINNNIISKRIKIHSHLIEFRGPQKTGGYYLKSQEQFNEA